MASSQPSPSSSSASLSSATSPTARDRRNRPAFLRRIIVIRLINAWCISTFFQPDEYFQALEPAWRLAFGPQSRAWLTWEWHRQLRSSLHPALFSLAYLLADNLSSWLPAGHALRTAVIMAAPKALQALIAALGDWYTWRLAVDIYGADTNYSFFVLFLQLLSPWQWYVSTRTFSNSLETTLTAMALYYWPWNLLAPAAPAPAKDKPKPPKPLTHPWRLRASLCLAALAVVLRPTNVLIWATVVGLTLTRLSLRGLSPLTRPCIVALFRDAALCGGLVAALSLVSDRLYFGFWTFPPLNWLNFNISKSLAVFYGRNPWHYYLLQGIPLLCTTSLPFALWGLVKPVASSAAKENTLKTLSYTVLTTVGALSLISHKEVRFIYPLLPALNILAAPRVASFFTSAPSPSSKSARPRPRLRNKSYLLAALAVNLCLAGYLSFFHQAAPLTVLSHLRHELFALFLTPCHSTPWRSHLVHQGLDAYALSCEPPLHTEPGSPERAAYRDEADRFYDDPLRFLRTELFRPGGLRAPRYIVGFEGIEPWLRRFLATDEAAALGLGRLDKVWAGFNGLFSDDWRRAGRLLVWDTGVYDDAPPPNKVGA
ncbi:alg9-like mannosyltransferase family protein [Hirsutella rhossiliensis]|uniref:Mannosyltransferase n=1 Tax=Hirsutella rhossiliensis TaxID=111463 RepID=A0A9P8MTY0_9HYPO|nr:alg9-like mannosyltransferase family domain-containing protein [Hirsutella rhossiliensis]KAH0959142.1 alg9-like mannosyltransferase family domain-containing protein [Hirsutella rhossiliensis]